MRELFNQVLKEGRHEAEDREALDSVGQSMIKSNVNELINQATLLRGSKKQNNEVIRMLEIAYRNGYQTKSKELFDDCCHAIRNAGDWS